MYQYTKEEFFEPIDESPLNEDEPDEKSEQPNYEKEDVDMATAMKQARLEQIKANFPSMLLDEP